MKSIKLSDYFEIRKPTYKWIQITPDKSIRNYNSTNIAKAICHTFKTLNRRIKKEQKKLIIESNFKITYMIDIQKGDVCFYFIVPQFFESILLEKISEIWSRATIEEVEPVEEFSSSAERYQLTYKKENALSLMVDKKTNEPLNQILSVMDIMKDNDRVAILYNFLPRPQFGWLKEYEDTMEKIKEKKSVEKEKMNAKYIIETALGSLLNLLDGITEVVLDFTGGSKRKPSQTFYETIIGAIEKQKELSPSTKRKKELNVTNVQIAICSQSLDKTRAENNALSISQAYRVLDEDNELVHKKVNSTFKIEDYSYKGCDENTFSTDECQNFIQVPGRFLLRQFGIHHVKTTENPVPSQLREGFFSLGTNTCKGIKTEAYLENEYNIGNLPLVLIGSQGSGKTTYMKNIAKNCHYNKEGIFILDFIKNCELSEDIMSVIPKEDVVCINLANETDVQGLGYNEIKINKNMSAFQKLNLASLQSQQIMNLVDSISVGDPLSSRMRRFLNAAANVVFSLGYSSIKNAIECLEDYKKRERYINELDKDLTSQLSDEINSLKELDDWSKATKDKPSEKIGTREAKIEHILDRVCMLREDFKLKFMYNKSCNNNIDLVNLMEEGKTVIIQMKESDFPTKMIKNILVTYWISKIWLTAQIRGSLHTKPLRSNIVVDEIFQAPTCLKMLEYILPQSRKFGAKFILSTQYISQLDSISDTLDASGSSYMLLKGCLEDDFKHFASKLEGYEYDDLRDLEKFHSLNLIYHSGGYSAFTTKLPNPIIK